MGRPQFPTPHQNNFQGMNIQSGRSPSKLFPGWAYAHL